MESDLAVLAIGGVVVSVYPSITAQEVGYLLYDSGATVAIIENEEQLAKLRWLAENPCPIPGSEDRAGTTATVTVRLVLSFEQVDSGPAVAGFAEIVLLSQVLAGGAEDPFDLVKDLRRDNLATLVYTSGTTGPPKGVMQTHGNHLSNVRQADQCGLYVADSTIMLFLPLAHSFAKLMGYIGFLTSVKLLFAGVTNPKSSKPDPASWGRDIREGSAHIVPTVPRLLEKMQAGIQEKIAAGGLMAGLLGFAISSASEVAVARREGRSPSLLAQIGKALTGALRRKIRRALFGPTFRYAVSGGAKLPIDVAKFFDALEIEVLEGYGLTETCVATNVNRTKQGRIGTVGPVLAPDIEVRIAGDGEILFKGPNVATGYYNRPTATKQAWDDEGWFHTGDLGSISADGFLSITGRKKELIVTAGGKKIPPEVIEQKIKGSLFISQIVMLGEGKPYCVALVTINEEAVRQWGTREGMAFRGPLHEDASVKELIENEVNKVNKTLASFETIKRIALIGDEFTIDNGLLTPTFKVKRREVERRYASAIEGLYGAGE
jgi:long-chain acyl-CoA synthetase